MSQIGQASLFAPEGKLKNRVELQRISVAEARNALEKHHYLHRARTGRTGRFTPWRGLTSGMTGRLRCP